MTEPLPRLTLGELASRILSATDSEARLASISHLARFTQTPEQIEAIAHLFVEFGFPGRRAFLEWIARVQSPLPDSVFEQLRKLLSIRSISLPVRLAAAARALKALPDEPESVLIITRPLTAGLSPLRRLERLRQLQHQMEQSRGLDLLIERREARVKMDCPRCGRRFPRETMVRHLWHEHGLLLERGKIRSPQRTVAELMEEHASTHDTTVLDRTSLLADFSTLREWVAAESPAEDIEPILAEAEEHRTGLCPGCFGELAPALAPLPPPLVRAPGRISGDGYTVEIGGADWFRMLTVSTPNRVLQTGPDGRRAFGNRGLATLASAFVLSLAMLLAVLGSRDWAAPRIIARLMLVSAGAYGLVRYLRNPPPSSTQRAVDAAWDVLARRMVKGNHTSTWLTRLCRASQGHGDSIARAGVLHEVLVQATAGDTDADVQLLAAANVLQVDDGSRHGRDRVAGMAALAGAGFRGAEPIEYAEYVAECFMKGDRQPDAGERARFRTLLLAAAFEAGLKPRDLIDLWNVAPNLRRAMIIEPLHRLALLQGIWAMRPARRWEHIAPAESVYDLCRTAPHVSGRILADYPDLLLYHRPDPNTERQLGPVLICTRGVAIGGRILADPDTEVRIAKAARGGFELIFGNYRMALEHKPARDFADTIREWLRFRAWALLPLLDNYLSPGSPEIAKRVLKPFQRRCPKCGTVSAIAVGKVGRMTK